MNMASLFSLSNIATVVFAFAILFGLASINGLSDTTARAAEPAVQLRKTTVNQQDDEPKSKTRTIKIIAPSITCFTRFDEGLKKRIRDPHTWVHSLKLNPLHKKVVLPRPEFDFGNDVEIEFQIDEKKPVMELAKIMISNGFSPKSILTSGHKMKDYKNVPLEKLVQPTK